MIEFTSFFLGFIFALILGLIILYGLGFNYKYMYHKFIAKEEPSEIHIETIFIDEVYEKLIDYVKTHNVMCMVTTTNEYELFKATYGFNYTLDEISRILRNRYKVLSEHAKIGLHTHIAPNEVIDLFGYEDQYHKIIEGYNFLKSMNIIAEDFAPGWWSYNGITIDVCKDIGIKNFHVNVHELKGCEKPNKLNFIYVRKFFHDYELLKQSKA
ncbi:MAG: hypothetical protein H3Z52_08005 [archaeon]|nr:hypothetical protein [archaeon]MCP8320866.1 hypothetical protein [archaeon]